MSGQEDMGSPAVGTGADREAQQRLSRRSVLRGAAGAGVAGIAATALAGSALPAVAASARPAVPVARGMKTETKDAGADADQIVVHVRDVESGEIDVFRGTGQTRLRDPELAARLVRASR
jgi:nitrous oxide reductase